MAKVLITIPVVEMELDELPDDRGSLDVWVHRALQAALQLQDNDNYSSEEKSVILERYGISRNPFDGRLWKLTNEMVLPFCIEE